MKRRNFFAFICGVAIAIILATILNWLNPSFVVAQANATLLVAAAASLQDALKEIQPLYQ